LPLRSLLCRSLAWSPVPTPGAILFSLPIVTGIHQFTTGKHVRSGAFAKSGSDTRAEGRGQSARASLPATKLSLVLSGSRLLSVSKSRQGRSSGPSSVGSPERKGRNVRAARSGCKRAEGK
jgi:hypothetical protein